MKKIVLAAVLFLGAAGLVFAQMGQDTFSWITANETDTDKAADPAASPAPASEAVVAETPAEPDPQPMLTPGMSDDYRRLLFGDTAIELQRQAEEEERQRKAAELAARKAAEEANMTMKAALPGPMSAIPLEVKPVAPVVPALPTPTTGSQLVTPAAVTAAPSVNEWDFGRVKSGEVLEHEFLLSNTGSRVLTIKEVHTSCGCTVAEVDRKILDRGETAVLKVRVNTKGESGKIKQHVYVNSDDADNPVRIFKVGADVVK